MNTILPRTLPRSLPRTLLAVPLALAALAGFSGCGAERGGDSGPQPKPDSASPTGAAESGADTLALTADGSTAGRCAMPSAETLATFDTAFEGTVTSVGHGTATLAVDQWYAGGEASTVTVEAPSKALEDLLMAVDFEEGNTYLVSADGDRVTLCGFTAETSPELEALYDQAFPAQG